MYVCVCVRERERGWGWGNEKNYALKPLNQGLLFLLPYRHVPLNKLIDLTVSQSSYVLHGDNEAQL